MKPLAFFVPASLLFTLPLGSTTETERPERIVGVREWSSSFVVGGLFLGAPITETFEFARVLVVDPASPSLWETAARSSPSVRYVERNEVGEMLTESSFPNDPLFSTQYGPGLINAPDVWNKQLFGAGARSLCFVDTGITMTHEEYDTANNPRYIAGYDSNGDGVPNDEHADSHGSINAAVAVALTNNSKGIAGVSPLANFSIAKLKDSTTAQKVTAIEFCKDNSSIHSWSLACGLTLLGECAESVHDAITAAWEAGDLIIVSAGNVGNSGVQYPANYSEAIAIANVDATKEIATLSSRGADVELSAPGQNILGPVKTGQPLTHLYNTLSGTSEASPHVAGAAALLWNYEPELPNTVVRDILDETAEDLGAPGRDPTYGFGLVDADAAVETVYPKSLPTCRFYSPTRFDDTVAIRPNITGNLTFKVWAKNHSASVALSSVQIVIDNSTTVNLSGTSNVRIFEATINVSSYGTGFHELRAKCTEADSDTREHSRLYNVT